MRVQSYQKRIILNADDFGRSMAVNVAVMRAHREGVLTSTSLMVTGDAVEEAVELARQAPTLAVGLHLVLVDGAAVLPPADIPHLVDSHGHFLGNPLRLGLLYFAHPVARAEMARELEAQFERFAETGLALSHVDGHLHMHVHPTVFNLLLPLAERYGSRGVRVPRDDLWLSLQHDRRMVGTKVLWALAFGLLSGWCRSRLRGHSLSVTHRVYGLMQSGCMRESYVLAVLQRLAVPTAELYFHPSVVPGMEPLGPNTTDLDTLLSPGVRQVIRDRDLCPTKYAHLG
jgi:hopanoid biosynthesis associated protein HpnK